MFGVLSDWFIGLWRLKFFFFHFVCQEVIQLINLKSSAMVSCGITGVALWKLLAFASALQCCHSTVCIVGAEHPVPFASLVKNYSFPT